MLNGPQTIINVTESKINKIWYGNEVTFLLILTPNKFASRWIESLSCKG